MCLGIDVVVTHRSFLLKPLSFIAFIIRATFVIDRGDLLVVFQARSNTLCAIKASLVVEDGFNLRADQGVRTSPELAFATGAGPLVKRGTIKLEYVAHPLDRVFGSVVIDKLQADHQRV